MSAEVGFDALYFARIDWQEAELRTKERSMEMMWQASASLGMSRYQNYRYVVLPQALRQMIPPLTSQAISLIKDSALVSTIAIYDLTMQGQQIVAVLEQNQ